MNESLPSEMRAPESICGLRCRVAAFKARANSALQSDSSAGVRMKRYHENIKRAAELQLQLDALVNTRKEAAKLSFLGQKKIVRDGALIDE